MLGSVGDSQKLQNNNELTGMFVRRSSRARPTTETHNHTDRHTQWRRVCIKLAQHHRQKLSNEQQHNVSPTENIQMNRLDVWGFPLLDDGASGHFTADL